MRRTTFASGTLLGLVLTLWLLGTAALVWLMLWLPNTAASTRSRDRPVQVPDEAGAREVAELLAREGVITEPRAFAFYLHITGASQRLRHGWVAINPSFTPRLLLSRIAHGYPLTSVDVVIPEGFTRFDVATRLERYGVCERAALLRAIDDRALLAELGLESESAEGYLFPALYGFLQDSPPERVVARMVGTFRARAEPLFAARETLGSRSASLTPHEVVTLASIVEREARLSEERPTIAGVFVNRLLDPTFKPKRLQADPTVAYGCLMMGERIPSCREFDGRRITPAMVRDPENPYSTYRHEGLPPGPICNPGLASLQAALLPEPHDYLYFVAKGGGRHAFARTLDEHNINVRPAPSAP